jgi:hypothetical protein
VERPDPSAEARFFESLAYASKFLMGNSDLHTTLERLTRALEASGIAYAIVGALALGEYGYRRTTDDVDILLSPQGLLRFKEDHLGRGYLEKFAGSKGMRDTQTGVSIDVVLAGEYPGDGKPKPVRFPDPSEVAVRGERVALLPLERLIDIKLASGMTAPHRLRDLADVLELIRAQRLPADLASRLDPFVREKYAELWNAAATAAADD